VDRVSRLERFVQRFDDGARRSADLAILLVLAISLWVRETWNSLRSNDNITL
jgi:hypothetical protein